MTLFRSLVKWPISLKIISQMMRHYVLGSAKDPNESTYNMPNDMSPPVIMCLYIWPDMAL